MDFASLSAATALHADFTIASPQRIWMPWFKLDLISDGIEVHHFPSLRFPSILWHFAMRINVERILELWISVSILLAWVHGFIPIYLGVNISELNRNDLSE